MSRNPPGPPCVICGESSVARELCAKHYKRWQRHGHTKQTRPDDWGLKERHPLWHSWSWTRRVGRDSRWNDFWQFVSDVGVRPAEEYRLRRRRIDRPFGPENWYWAEPVSETGVGPTKKSKAEYARKWRAKNPLKAKQNDLKKMFGITLAEYEAMLTEQGGVCAICGQEDQWFSLAVDHCHGTKRIRGLLCTHCNRGIGHFKDSPDLLRKAANYLQHPTRLI